jgi:hypothetical protein
MKFSKLMLLCTGVLMTGSLMASDEVKDSSHTPYLAYEFGNSWVNHPSLGYRFQKGALIYDINAGYRYFNSHYSPVHFGKVGINLYKAFPRKDDGQLYAGLGADFQAMKYETYYHHRKTDYSFQPSVSFGHHFSVNETKKVFTEFTYKPYEFGNSENKAIHSIGMRIGVGL